MYSVEPAACKIVFQNARSLHKHFSDLSTDHNIIASDIITVAESRLIAADDDSMYTIDGFTIHRNDQQQTSRNRPPHGQVLYMAEHCTIFMVNTFSSPMFECSIIRLASHRNLQIATVYKSPECNYTTFRHQMSTQLLPHLDLTLPVVILGDFNLDLFKKQQPFVTFMENSFHCHQYVNKPTTTSGSILDLVFANTALLSCDAVYCAWSDHKTISVAV
jgi:hypothetical protein